MDQMAGLVFDWSDETNRNYRTKYVAVADKGYAGAGAYYNGDFIAVANQTSISAFFSYGWGTLHELAHGYQGYFGRGVGGGVNLCFNETGNNVLAYYIQMISHYIKTQPIGWMTYLLRKMTSIRKD